MNAPAHDSGRLALMLNELRLPTIGRLWSEFAERSDKEGWPAARLLDALLEHELAEHAKRRIERHRTESHLDPTKTLATFDFSMVPMVSKAHITALATTGDSWLEKGATILLLGPPGTGKSHLGSAIGHALIDAGFRVLFTHTSELVQRLQAARQTLQLPSALAKLGFDLIILDDLSYAYKDQAETSMLFELIVERYERKNLLTTANQPFSGWNEVFPDPSMTIAAIDRLVHHSTIFELNVESYRRRKVSDKQSVRRQQLPSDNYEEGATTIDT